MSSEIIYPTIESFEKGLLINLLGLLEAVERDLVSTSKAEKYLFNAFRNEKLEGAGISDDILEILSEAGFIDDANILGEASFKASCKSLKEALYDALRKREGSPLEVKLSF